MRNTRNISVDFPRIPRVSPLFQLWRLANACRVLWRELFTRAFFLIGLLIRKQGD